MPQRELRRRERPGRSTGNWQPIDLQVIEKLCERVCLVRG
jgi:hypothetical protein